ncbi:MAG: TerB family tellurite resistance protein [Pseudomonadota bacterium]
MHIALGVLSALGLIIWWIIRLNHARCAGRELAETASDIKGLVRRTRWKRKHQTDPFVKIEDPRIAATAMMCAVAKCDGDISERQRAAILELVVRELRVDRALAEDLLAQGRWLTNEMKDLNALLRRASEPIQKTCTAAEKRHLLAMLESVATVEGEANDHQSDGLRYLEERFNLQGA